MKSDLFLPNADFLDEFMELHKNQSERRFCWVLGTGASASSGLPLGRELTQRWLMEMYEIANPKSSLKEWTNQEFESVPNFTYERAANFYHYIYQCRFQSKPEDGLVFLESLLENAKPSFGYKVLAQIMAHTRHRAAITTNFDNLISTSITLYTEKEPLVCGNESLADFVIKTLRRPLVAKIHRDFLLASQNDPYEIIQLANNWKRPLTEIFKHYTPILVGFGDHGGSGGSLMRFLEDLPPIEGGIFWCYREKNGTPPAEEIQSLVKHHNGSLVPIMDFDKLMFQFWNVLKMTSALNELDEKYKKLIKDYQHGFSLTADEIIALNRPGMSETIATTVKSANAALERLREDSFL